MRKRSLTAAGCSERTDEAHATPLFYSASLESIVPKISQLKGQTDESGVSVGRMSFGGLQQKPKVSGMSHRLSLSTIHFASAAAISALTCSEVRA
jgi:hypothetical protein